MVFGVLVRAEDLRGLLHMSGPFTLLSTLLATHKSTWKVRGLEVLSV